MGCLEYEPVAVALAFQRTGDDYAKPLAYCDLGGGLFIEPPGNRRHAKGPKLRFVIGADKAGPLQGELEYRLERAVKDGLSRVVVKIGYHYRYWRMRRRRASSDQTSNQARRNAVLHHIHTRCTPLYTLVPY